MRFKDMIKLEDSITKATVHCKCGHSIVFNPTCKKDKIICTHCGNYVFKNKEAEKEYKLKNFQYMIKRQLN